MREIEYDIAVVGSGPAGIVAAVEASRLGCRTLLVEKDGFIGGMSTSGLLSVWCGDARCGLFRRLLPKTSVTLSNGARIYCPEKLKEAYLEELDAAGAELLLQTTFIDAEVDGGRIGGITLFGKNNRIKLRAGVYLDCTGDGDLAQMVGAAYSVGRESDNRCQPASIIFAVGGVSEEGVRLSQNIPDSLRQKLKEYLFDGRVGRPVYCVIMKPANKDGVVQINMTNVSDVDASDLFSLTEATLTARRQIPQIVKFLRENAAGFENCCTVAAGQGIGIRESRHIHCDYMLTEQDIIAGRVFDDRIVSGARFNFDIHSITGDPSERNGAAYNNAVYTIPYRCLLPRGVDNLLLAGRCIGGTHIAHSSFRVMPICMAMGEGAGAAAAYCIKHGVPTRGADIHEIQKKLGI